MRNPCVAVASVAVALLLSFGTPRIVSAQERSTIRGTVTDAQTGEPVPGAQVVIRGSGIGTITNNEGAYLLVNAPSGRVELRVEFIGYAPLSRAVTVPAGGTVSEDFQLGIAAIQLDELVATGYAQQTRREVSSAISAVNAAEVANPVVASLDAVLQGKTAGVHVVQNAGNPGNGITISVRGLASITAGNQPLYVVDGLPIWRGDFAQLGLGGQDLSAVTSLNPDEIESIDILKDAAASAIYGSRGSNGVVMITTKRGIAGQPRLTISMSSGFQEVERKIDMLETDEWIQYFSDGMRYDGYAEADIQAELNDLGVDPTINTDWQQAVLRTAPVTNSQISLSGGADRLKYYLSGAYFDQKGIIIGSAYSRASGRVNLDFQASDRFTLTSSVALVRESNDRIESDNSITSAVTNAIANEPWVPIYTEDGEYSDAASYSNPVAVGREDNANARTLRTFGNVTARYGLSDWLNLTGRAGFDVLGLREHRWNSPLTPLSYAAGVGGVSRLGNSWGQRYLLESYLTGDRFFGPHEVSATVGGSVELDDRDISFVRGEGFTSPELQWPTNAAEVTEYDGTAWEHNLLSYFGRATYAFSDRFVVNASARFDGSSRFGESRKFGFFPAASAAWNVSNESFMSGLEFLSDLKFRASWGVTGNEAIGDFQYLGVYETSNYGKRAGTAPTRLPNPDLKWETTSEWNVGLDLNLFDDRIGLVAELYRKETDDLLLSRPLTATTGYTSALQNVGGIRNSGIEFNLHTVNIRPGRPGGLEWTTQFNLTHNENEVTALYNGEPFSAGFINRVEVGQPLGVFFAPRYVGVDRETGIALYADLDDNGELQYDGEGEIVTTGSPTSDDRLVVGTPHPDFYGGLRNTFSYGAFDVTAFVEYSQGAQIYNAMREYSDDGGLFLDNKFSKHVEDYWTPENKDATNPSPSWSGSTGVWIPSSRMIEDASYVRLGEVTLGFELPAVVLNLLRTSNARVYASGSNLYTWTDFSGYAPDSNYSGSGGESASLSTDFYAYPRARTITFGFEGTW